MWPITDQTFTRNLRKVCIGSTCLKGRTTRQEWHVVNSEAAVPKSLGQGEGEATIIWFDFYYTFSHTKVLKISGFGLPGVCRPYVWNYVVKKNFWKQIIQSQQLFVVVTFCFEMMSPRPFSRERSLMLRRTVTTQWSDCLWDRAGTHLLIAFHKCEGRPKYWKRLSQPH